MKPTTIKTVDLFLTPYRSLPYSRVCVPPGHMCVRCSVWTCLFGTAQFNKNKSVELVGIDCCAARLTASYVTQKQLQVRKSSVATLAVVAAVWRFDLCGMSDRPKFRWLAAAQVGWTAKTCFPST